MDPSEVLAQAWDVVQKANLPASIQPVAFTEAVRMISDGATLEVDGGGSGSRGTQQGSKASTRAGKKAAAVEPKPAAPSFNDGLLNEEQAVFAKLVEETGVNLGRLEKLVTITDNGTVNVRVSASSLGKSKGPQARSVMQLVTMVRQYGMGEQVTSADDVIRVECQRKRCYDVTNFWKHIDNVDGYSLRGTGKSRKIEVKSEAVKAFPAFVDTLNGIDAKDG